jgi:hypothetical protein
MHSNIMTPNAKKSTATPWFYLHITSGAIYPGVPLVSDAFDGLHTLAIPISVNLKYPLESNTKFSGFKSLWMTPC